MIKCPVEQVDQYKGPKQDSQNNFKQYQDFHPNRLLCTRCLSHYRDHLSLSVI